MKNLILILMVLVSVGCKESGGSASLREGGTPNLSGKTVAFFGDSITQDTLGYSPILTSMTGINAVNYAVGGTIAAEQYAEVVGADLTGVEYAIIFSGYNDMRLYGLNASQINVYKQDIRLMVSHLISQGIRVYVTTCLRMPASSYADYAPFNQGSDAAALAYSVASAEVVSEFDPTMVSLVDVNAGFDPQESYFRDRVHPNEIGSQILADLFYNNML